MLEAVFEFYATIVFTNLHYRSAAKLKAESVTKIFLRISIKSQVKMFEFPIK